MYIYIYMAMSQTRQESRVKKCKGLKIYDRAIQFFICLQIRKADVFYFSKSTR